MKYWLTLVLFFCFTASLFSGSLALAQCGGINVGGQCLPPPCAPGSPLGCPNQSGGPAAAPADYFASFAIDDHWQVNWGMNYPTAEAAQSGAVEGCRSMGRTGCHVMGGGFGNLCGVYAMNPQGYDFGGFDYVAHLAERKAMEECNTNTPTGKCRLMSSAICIGTRYPRGKNNAATKRGDAELEEMSVKLDKRQYWGALGDDGKGGGAVAYDLSSQTAAEQQVHSKCAGCAVLVTFESSCGAQAWPRDESKQQFNETAVDLDPALAKSKAKTQCDQKYGSCNVAVRCSGRRYFKNNPDAGDWGAFASDGRQRRVRSDLATSEMAEEAVLGDCAGCKLVRSYSNSCLAIAHPSNDQPVFETAIDPEPAAAWKKADAQCKQKYGACKTTSNCSGQRYPVKQPFTSDHPPS